MNRFYHGALRDSVRRLLALTQKEFQHMLRDRSTLAIGVFLPMVLIVIFGYGLSLDLKETPVAVALEDSSPVAYDAVSSLSLSPYFSVVTVASMQEAEQLMRAQKVKAIVRIPNHFSSEFAAGKGYIQVLLHGVDANTASIVQNYIQAAMGVWAQKRQERNGNSQLTSGGSVTVESRMWFNTANSSTWFLVPGLIVLIVTLVGTFLTSLVVAREWERGTLESLFVTPVRPLEILIAKIIPYFTIGLFGWALCLFAAKFLFEVPIYGSLIIIFIASVLYLLVAVGMGLLISSVTKNQFIASQLALVLSFMPATMLSGFLFDLRNVPVVVRYIGQMLPATYFMELLKTLFLAGNVWPLIIKNGLILCFYAVLFLVLAKRATRKKLD